MMIILLFFPKAFDMGDEEHEIILQKVQESKVRHFTLLLSLLFIFQLIIVGNI